jgi:hypothetical protein
MSELTDFADAEWGVLVGLPQAVVIAAMSAQHDSASRTESEAQAGMTAIADARDCGSPLIERVAAEIVERVGDPEDGLPPLPVFTDRAGGIEDVLNRCQEAVLLLAAKADEHEAQAYRHWLVEIAEQVVGASASGGFIGIGSEQVSDAESAFIDKLRGVLAD